MQIKSIKILCASLISVIYSPYTFCSVSLENKLHFKDDCIECYSQKTKQDKSDPFITDAKKTPPTLNWQQKEEPLFKLKSSKLPMMHERTTRQKRQYYKDPTLLVE